MGDDSIIIPLGRKNVKCGEGFRWGKVVVCQMFKFGFVGALKIEIVGADVLDGPMPTREDSLSGKGYLRGVEDVAPYIWVT